MQQKSVPILLRLPPSLVKRIEASARAAERSRNSEARVRLAESFRKTKGVAS